jgi:hypothetical protein
MEGRAEAHEKDNRRFSQLCEIACNIQFYIPHRKARATAHPVPDYVQALEAAL